MSHAAEGQLKKASNDWGTPMPKKINSRTDTRQCHIHNCQKFADWEILLITERLSYCDFHVFDKYRFNAEILNNLKISS